VGCLREYGLGFPFACKILLPVSIRNLLRRRSKNKSPREDRADSLGFFLKPEGKNTVLLNLQKPFDCVRHFPASSILIVVLKKAPACQTLA
jgi:hypothetical protein